MRLRSLLFAPLGLGLAGCAAPLSRAPTPAPPTVAARYVGLYTPGFERARFRACTRWGLPAREAWRIAFTDAALAERDLRLASLRGTGTAGAAAPLVLVLDGRVSHAAPGRLGNEPRRTLLVERVVILRPRRGWRERGGGLWRTCASMERDDPFVEARWAAT